MGTEQHNQKSPIWKVAKVYWEGKRYGERPGRAFLGFDCVRPEESLSSARIRVAKRFDSRVENIVLEPVGD